VASIAGLGVWFETMVSRIYVIEEARHVRYAREELARQVRAAGKRRLAFDRLVIARAAYLTGRRLIAPEVYRAVGIDPAVGRRAVNRPAATVTCGAGGAAPESGSDARRTPGGGPAIGGPSWAR